MKIYWRSGCEKQRLVFIAYVLEGLSRKSGLLWDRAPINRKTTNSFWATEDLVHFYPQYFHSNTFKLQFDREDIPLHLLYSIVHKNKPIYFINEVFTLRTQICNQGMLMKKYESVFFIPWPQVNFHINRGDFLLKIRGRPWTRSTFSIRPSQLVWASQNYSSPQSCSLTKNSSRRQRPS